MRLFYVLIFTVFFNINLSADDRALYRTLSGENLLEVHFKKELMLKSKSHSNFPINVDENANCTLLANSKKEEIFVSAGSKWKAEQTYVSHPTVKDDEVHIYYELTNKANKSINMECTFNLSGKILIDIGPSGKPLYSPEDLDKKREKCLSLKGVPESYTRQSFLRQNGGSHMRTTDIDCYKDSSPTTVENFKKAFKSHGIDLVFLKTEGKEIWGSEPVKRSNSTKPKSNN